MKIAAFHLQHLIEYARLRGVSTRVLFESISHPPEYLVQEGALVSTDTFYDVLEVINNQLQDELFGIRSGEYLNLNALGLIYRISLETTTVEEAFFYLGNYLSETFPLIEIDPDIDEKRTKIFLHIQNEREALNRIILENTLTVMSRELKQMAGEQARITLFSPLATSDYPSGWSNASSFSLQLESAILKATMKDPLRYNLDLLVPAYLKMIETLKGDGSFPNKVRIAALNLAKPELPDLKTVSMTLNLTPRTLQRRLADEKTSFREIISGLKQTISQMLLQHERFSISDISFVLGYSEPAAFIHSFKKWHGSSPQKVRESLQVS